jgi:hypothetical protein
MDRQEAEKVIKKAKDLVDRLQASDYVDVDEVSGGKDIESQVIEVEGGTWVRAFVFVPTVP